MFLLQFMRGVDYARGYRSTIFTRIDSSHSFSLLPSSLSQFTRYCIPLLGTVSCQLLKQCLQFSWLHHTVRRKSIGWDKIFLDDSGQWNGCHLSNVKCHSCGIQMGINFTCLNSANTEARWDRPICLRMSSKKSTSIRMFDIAFSFIIGTSRPARKFCTYKGKEQLRTSET